MSTTTNAAAITTTAADEGSARVPRGRLFPMFARWSAKVMGSHWSFIIATALCLLWAVSGPFFHYSDTWQLVINTATTVLTFLAVFLMQTRRTRRAGNPAELDELLRAVQPARTRLVNLEECTDEELEALRKEFEHLQKRERERAPATFATPQGS